MKRIVNRAYAHGILSKIFCVSFFLCIAASMDAQDVITLKNGEEIKALVQEIGLNEVKYKKFDNQSGPNYTLKKDEVFMIKYANGSKDMFKDEGKPVAGNEKTEETQNLHKQDVRIGKQAEPNASGLLSSKKWIVSSSTGIELSMNEVRSIMASDPAALMLYNDGIRQLTNGRAFGIVTAICAGGVVISSIIDLAKDRGPDAGTLTCAVLMTGFMIPYVIIVSAANKKIAKSVSLYNNSVLQLQRTSNVSLTFGGTRSGGIGFTLNF